MKLYKYSPTIPGKRKEIADSKATPVECHTVLIRLGMANQNYPDGSHFGIYFEDDSGRKYTVEINPEEVLKLQNRLEEFLKNLREKTL